MGKLSAVFRAEIASKTDERSRVMNEIIAAMRLIKMYAWEKPFSSLIERLRRYAGGFVATFVLWIHKETAKLRVSYGVAINVFLDWKWEH